MKKIALILGTVFLLTGCTAPLVSSPSYAQGYEQYAPPPADTYAHPWVGPGTPWVYYNGDWFLNGVLYYFFGPLYGWAPYYAYPSFDIVRPGEWYGHRWWHWYHGHPHYWHFFEHHYPYWLGHREGYRYGRGFYERYNRGQGRGWHGGFHRSWGHNRYNHGWGHPGWHQQTRWGHQYQPRHQHMYRGQQFGPQHGPVNMGGVFHYLPRQARRGQHFRAQHRQMGNQHRPQTQRRPQGRHGGQGSHRGQQHQHGHR